MAARLVIIPLSNDRPAAHHHLLTAPTCERDACALAHLADKIDLMGLDANTAIARDQAFHWVGTAPLNGPGEVGFHVTSAGNTIIRASNDADAATEFEIQLTGIKTLTAVDFYM